MKLYGYSINKGDTVYSESMGSGRVEQVSANSLYVNHHGQRWRYNDKLVRSGCKQSDLGWHPRKLGVQVKGNHKKNKAESVIDGLTQALGEHYG